MLGLALGQSGLLALSHFLYEDRVPNYLQPNYLLLLDQAQPRSAPVPSLSPCTSELNNSPINQTLTPRFFTPRGPLLCQPSCQEGAPCSCMTQVPTITIPFPDHSLLSLPDPASRRRNFRHRAAE